MNEYLNFPGKDLNKFGEDLNKFTTFLTEIKI